MFSVLMTASARKEFSGLSVEDRDHIATKVKKLATYPHVGIRIVKLVGFDCTYRIRVGNYRVFFEVDSRGKIILITKVADRKEAYR